MLGEMLELSGRALHAFSSLFTCKNVSVFSSVSSMSKVSCDNIKVLLNIAFFAFNPQDENQVS